MAQANPSIDAADPAWRWQALGRLAAGMAHEFNNILQDVISNVELALDALPATGPGRAQAEQAIEAALQGADLTARLGAFYRPKASHEPLDLAALLHETHAILARTCGRRATVTLDVDDALPRVALPAAPLQTLLVHLALDAVAAFGGNGKVAIVAAGRPPEVRLTASSVAAAAWEGTGLALARRWAADCGASVQADDGVLTIRFP